MILLLFSLWSVVSIAQNLLRFFRIVKDSASSGHFKLPSDSLPFISIFQGAFSVFRGPEVYSYIFNDFKIFSNCFEAIFFFTFPNMSFRWSFIFFTSLYFPNVFKTFKFL